MTHYIDKSALVAEIEKLIERAKAERVLYPKTILAAKNYLLIEDYNKLLSFLDALEVKETEQTLLKPADGEDLPELEREVIVLYQPYPLEGSEYAVSFGHRPDSKGWDGTNIVTGKVEHYTPKTYDKGGWNIPNIKWWLDYNIDELLHGDKK